MNEYCVARIVQDHALSMGMAYCVQYVTKKLQYYFLQNVYISLRYTLASVVIN